MLRPAAYCVAATHKFASSSELPCDMMGNDEATLLFLPGHRRALGNKAPLALAFFPAAAQNEGMSRTFWYYFWFTFTQLGSGAGEGI
jgi:hypothetical protein